MRSAAGFLLLTLLASCDFVYSVTRTTPVDSTFDRSALEQWARQQVGYQLADDHAWDGEYSAHSFQRGLGTAYVEFAPGALSVGSFRIGPPSDDEFHAWLRLQIELISALRERFPFLPPETAWQVTSSYLEAELAAGAGEPQ
jgi:hypothetical protein